MTDTIAEFAPTSADIDAMVNPRPKDLVAETEDLCRHGEWLEASQNLKRLLRMDDPDGEGYTKAQCYHALADCAMNLRMNGQAITHYQEALRLDPTIHTAHENLIFLLDAQPWTTDKQAHKARQAWWTHIGAPAYALRQPFTTTPDPEKRLRVGYVSSDFRFHSALISFYAAVFEPTEQIEPVYYSTLPVEHYDHITRLVKEKWGPAFVDVSRLTQHAFADVVRQDQIDILVDLSGYTAGNRLQAFAECPAPIRITAWGYATGVASPAMTHLFADPIVATEAVRARLHEQVVDLPCVIGFHSRDDDGFPLPEPNPLPSLTGNLGPRFAVFQRASKLNEECFQVWTTILQQVPDSAIIFKGVDFTSTMRETIVRHMKPVQGQIQFELGGSHGDHQLWYSICDLSLDPWPQTGGVSSMESLWMGVPVVTLTGDRVIQRTTHSILRTLGLTEFVTTSKRQYVKTAVEMVTTKRDWLNDVRMGLRNRMKASPIMHGYRDAVEAKYREIWRSYCASTKEEAA